MKEGCRRRLVSEVQRVNETDKEETYEDLRREACCKTDFRFDRGWGPEDRVSETRQKAPWSEHESRK